jgi:hypothetical protein
LLPAKFVPIADTQPAIAGALGKLLDKVVAGEDIRSGLTAELAARITPEASKFVQQRLSKLWPGGTLTLVKRVASSETGGQPVSTFRLSKGGEANLITFGLDSSGKVSRLGLSGDRDYE